MNKKSSSFLTNSIMNIVSNLVTIVISLGTGVIIARGLGVEGQGLYAIITLVPTLLVTFFNLGIGPATVYFIGNKRFSHNQILATNIYLSVIISIISFGVAFISIQIFKDSYFKAVDLSDLIVILIAIPFLFFNAFIQAIYQGLQKFKEYNLVNIYNKVIQFTYLVVLMLIGEFYLTSVLFSFIVASITSSILLIFNLYKVRQSDTSYAFSIELVREMLKYGFKAHLSNIVAFLNYRADLIMLTLLSSTYSVGIYNVAVLIAERLWVFSQPVSAALFPKISSMTDVDEKNKLTAFTMKTVLYFSIVFALVFALVSFYAVVLLFGEEYREATEPILILLVGITLFAAERILSNDLAGRGKPEYNLYTTIYTVICNVIFNFIFIPKYGFNGAALSTTIAYTLTFIVKICIFVRFTGTSLSQLFVIGKKDLNVYKQFVKKVVTQLSQ